MADNDTFANFPLLDNCVSKTESVSGISGMYPAIHLDELAKSFEGYFSNTEPYSSWRRQLFAFSVATADAHCHNEFLD